MALRSTSAAMAVALLLLPAAVSARDAERVGADAVGMGGAWRAVATGSAGAIYNPAGTAASGQYHLDTYTEFTDTFKRRAFGFAVADGQTNRWVGGMLGYTWQEFRDEQGRLSIRHVPRLAVSVPIVPNWLYIGAGFKYVWTNYAGRKRSWLNNVDLDAGVLLVTPFGLRAGVSAQNLIGSLTKGTRDVRWGRNVGFGVAYVAPFGLQMAYDLSLDLDADRRGRPLMRHAAGVGVVIKSFTSRIGWTYKPVGDEVRYGIALPDPSNADTDLRRRRGIHYLGATVGYQFGLVGSYVAYEQSLVDWRRRTVFLELRFEVDTQGAGGSGAGAQ